VVFRPDCHVNIPVKTDEKRDNNVKMQEQPETIETSSVSKKISIKFNFPSFFKAT
jgi:hypothetical protein